MPAERSPVARRRFATPIALLVVALLAVTLWQPTSVGAATVSADFTVSANVEAGVPVKFADRSTGAAWVYWNFGDGSNSRERNPQHTFASPGDYRVAYSVCATRTDCATERKTIAVAAPTTPGATADFSVPTDIKAGTPVIFTDRSTNAAWVYWNFGDGSNSRERNPQHTFASPGDYRVAYSVCATQTDCATERKTVTVMSAGTSTPPTGSIGAAPTNLASDHRISEQVRWGGSVSASNPTVGGRRLRWTDTNENETGYRVSTGRSRSQLTPLGDYPPNTTGVFNHDETQGCFEVRAVFGDRLGPPAWRCDRDSPVPNDGVNVEDILTVPAQPIAGEPVVFFVDDLGWNPFQLRALDWDFGEPGEPTATDPYAYVYEQSGTYDVSVSVVGCAPCRTATRTITVVAASEAVAESSLVAPVSVEYFRSRAFVTFADTNDDEDGYLVHDRGGRRIGTGGPNATSAVTRRYNELGPWPECVTVRAVKDDVLGPATDSCQFIPDRRPGTYLNPDVRDIELSPGESPGQLILTYTVGADTNTSLGFHELGIVDVALFRSGGNSTVSTVPPTCRQLKNGLSAFDHETGVGGVDLQRTYSVTIDGLTSGRTYAVGITHQADFNGATHFSDPRQRRACTPSALSPELTLS